MRSNIKIYVLATLVLSTSCLKEMEMDIEKQASKIVINCFFSPDNLFEGHVSQTISVLSQDTIAYLPDAEVNLYENDVFLEQMLHKANGMYTSTTIPEYDKEYTLTVSSPGLGRAESTDIVPREMFGVKLDTSILEGRYLDCTIHFKDDNLAINYYLVEVYIDTPILFHKVENNEIISTEIYQVPLIITDPITEDYNFGGLTRNIFYFSDQLINGQEHDLTFMIDFNNLNLSDDSVESFNLFFYLKNISEAYYLYAKSWHKSQQQQQQQTEFYSNIENGFGIFAGYSAFIDTVLIK